MKDLVGLIHAEHQGRGLPALTPRETRVPAVEGKVITVIGMRRAGKTFFLYQEIAELLRAGVPWSAILYLNLEDDRLLPLDRPKLARLLESFYMLYPENHDRRVFLFLDEVQNVDGWPAVLRRFLDTRDVRIFIAGSSAKLLEREIASALRGRSLSVEISPFSFIERLRFLGADLPVPGEIMGPPARDRLLGHLRAHLHAGGFPETVRMQAPERIRTLQGYVDVVILRDIVERHGIVNVSLVRYLIRALLANAGGRFSVNKLFNDLKSQGHRVAKNTLHDYVGHVEDAFLAFLIPIAAGSIRKRRVNPRKVYAVDPGLVQAFSFSSENLGPLFENLVYTDLRRRGCEVFYHSTRSGREVDFVARLRDGRARLYQATFDISDDRVLERERRALDEAREELGLEGRIITPEDYATEFLPELEAARDGAWRRAPPPR